MYNDELPSNLVTQTPSCVPLMEYMDAKQTSSCLLAIQRIEAASTAKIEPSTHLSTDSQLSDQPRVQQPTKTTHELWIGQTSGFITVLNAETLAVITYIYNPFELSCLPSYVTFLVTNHPHNIHYDSLQSSGAYEDSNIMVDSSQEDVLTVYGAVYDGQFVTRWDVEKRTAAESYNCEKHLEGDEGISLSTH